ncbi:MAG TPA: carboxylating nicotinate-nucleotide diphosphorylase [Methylocella sp.]|nr:carboxylating nicotinate-nucleotide diphosphorylase [Methylocella sp.]
MSLAPLPKILIEPLVRTALLEDLGLSGDLTTDLIVPPERTLHGMLRARDTGVVAGLDLARLAFALIDPAIEVRVEREEGAPVRPGEILARIHGPARGILTAERTALNFLGHMSGIASATAFVVAAVADTKAKIVCTRKTTPGLRVIEKYAVRAGGGSNHRFGLDDAILIKDNHIAIAGGAGAALRRAKAKAGHLVKIEIEVETLAELEEVLAIGTDAVLLDNMDLETLAKAVNLVNGRAITEASGRVNAKSAPAIAATGVDLISVGGLTHSAAVLDIGLDFEA